MFVTQLQTVPEGVDAFCTQRTFGLFFFLLFSSLIPSAPSGPPGEEREPRALQPEAAAPPRVGAQTLSRGSGRTSSNKHR